MKTDTRREFHYFMLPDYEKEEEYLRDMHKKGWKFTYVSLPGFYHFEKCEPTDVVYRIDFNPQNAEKKRDYLRMFEDYGWEYLQDLNEFSYFRKSADEADTEIFSDNASKVDMMRRVYTKRMLPILLIFFVAFMPNIGLMTRGLFELRLPEILLCVPLFVLFGLYIGILIHCFRGFRRLTKKYSSDNS